ncbi:MAG: hypothetical protein WC310_02385 [Patescibacteria group bacterium]|jgi:hypothetical protein
MISEVLQRAAKILETDGIKGINMVIEIIGKDMAVAMLVMHLRYNLGSGDHCPDEERISAAVTEILEREQLDAFSFVGDSKQHDKLKIKEREKAANG